MEVGAPPEPDGGGSAGVCAHVLLPPPDACGLLLGPGAGSLAAMMPSQKGSVRLFRFAGIDVFLHWSWFLVAFYVINNRREHYSSPLWNVLEYLALFLIVLLHEFGHSLACRQVGGQADQIVLWPLGGVAYVAPPQRPGAMLWSIAAGPLVNVALLPILTGLALWNDALQWDAALPSHLLFLRDIWTVNLVLLIFNLLPVYPLDGGQILRSLLWYVLGRARSLLVASLIGLVGVAGLFALALLDRSVWMGIMCAFILLNCWRGLMEARALARAETVPRHPDFACPVCRAAPPAGAFWQCGQCGKPFDTFASRAACPHCGAQYGVTMCVACRSVRPFGEWVVPPPLQR